MCQAHQQQVAVGDARGQSRVPKRCALNLDHFFYELRTTAYAVVRGLPDTVPFLRPGGDVDVFCYDRKELARHLFAAANDYIPAGFAIDVKDYKDQGHAHVDFRKDGKLDIRFDIYDEFPRYQKAHIKSELLLSVIENAQPIQRDWQGNPYFLWVPAPVDDLLLRYIEYVEHYELRPDKIKHLEYILSRTSADPARLTFLDKLHRYTDLPKCFEPTIAGRGVRPEYGEGICYHAKGLCVATMNRLFPESWVMRARAAYAKRKEVLGIARK